MNFWLECGVPPPPEGTEEQIRLHLDRRLTTKEVQQGLQIATIPFGRFVVHEMRRQLEQMLDEVEPEWRSYYTLHPLLSESARWINETTIAIARDELLLQDQASLPELRSAANAQIAAAREEARRRGFLAMITCRLVRPKSRTSWAQAELDESGARVRFPGSQGFL